MGAIVSEGDAWFRLVLIPFSHPSRNRTPDTARRIWVGVCVGGVPAWRADAQTCLSHGEKARWIGWIMVLFLSIQDERERASLGSPWEKEDGL